ncbi:hypothetical protein LTR94_029788, partial [Friedmanniomyces endolithicus]
ARRRRGTWRRSSGDRVGGSGDQVALRAEGRPARTGRTRQARHPVFAVQGADRRRRHRAGLRRRQPHRHSGHGADILFGSVGRDRFPRQELHRVRPDRHGRRDQGTEPAVQAEPVVGSRGQAGEGSTRREDQVARGPAAGRHPGAGSGAEAGERAAHVRRTEQAADREAQRYARFLRPAAQPGAGAQFVDPVRRQEQRIGFGHRAGQAGAHAEFRAVQQGRRQDRHRGQGQRRHRIDRRHR